MLSPGWKSPELSNLITEILKTRPGSLHTQPKPWSVGKLNDNIMNIFIRWKRLKSVKEFGFQTEKL